FIHGDIAVDELSVGDVAMDEIARVGQRLGVAGVGQLVEVDDRPSWPLTPQKTHEIRPDEAGAPGDQQFHFGLTSSFAWASDSNVPASVHQPCSRSQCSEPART